MKRTAAVMLLIILLAAGCADAEAGKPIFEMTPAGRDRCAHARAYSRANTGTYAGTDAGAHTIFEIRAYRKYVL